MATVEDRQVQSEIEESVEYKCTPCGCCKLSDEDELTDDQYIEREARKLLAKETSEDNDEKSKSKTCCGTSPDKLPRPLKRAYTLGVKGFIHGLWSSNPLKSSFKDFIVCLSVVLSFGALITCIYTLAIGPTITNTTSHDNSDIPSSEEPVMFLDIFSLVVSIPAFLFSAVDLFIHFEVRRCKTCIEWRAFCIRIKRKWSSANEERKCCTCCAFMVRYWDEQIRIQEKKANLRMEKAHKDDTATPDEDLEEFRKKLNWCENNCRKNCGQTIPFVMDCLRIFFTEMMYYPLLLTSIFGVIYEHRDGSIPTSARQLATLSRVAFALGIKVLTVYFQRVQLLTISYFSIQKSRLKRQDYSLNHSFLRGASWHLLFVFYSCSQMLIQILVILVTARAYYYYIDSNDDSIGSVQVRLSHIIFLIFIGYFIPLFGTVMFFVTAYSWVREFFIEFFDQLWKSIVQKKKDIEAEPGSKKLSEFIGEIDPFRKDYDLSFLTRLYYPVFNIPSLILCGCYTIFILAYVSVVWDIIAKVEEEEAWLIVINVACLLILIVNIHPILAFGFSFLVLVVAIIRFMDYIHNGCKDESDFDCIKNYCTSLIQFSTPVTISY